jgi:hypothetical protein
MSGESGESPIDPNATIQLDALDGVELEDAAPRGTESPAEVAGEAPPPLPGMEAPAGAPASVQGVPGDATVAKRGLGKILLYGAMFIALLAVAIAAGLSVGSRARPAPAVVPVASRPVAPTPPAAAAPSSEASPRTLTLPTIEIKGK